MKLKMTLSAVIGVLAAMTGCRSVPDGDCWASCKSRGWTVCSRQCGAPDGGEGKPQAAEINFSVEPDTEEDPEEEVVPACGIEA